MTKEKFLQVFSTEILQSLSIVSENDELFNLEDWDSLAKMALISFFDKEFNIALGINEVQQFKTVTDILKKANL